MTRLELLQLVIGRARSNGFELRRWYTTRLELPWISVDAAIALLDTQRRYYALIFSHEFAQTFWKPGTEISFDVPSQSFQRPMPDGTVRTVERKRHIRRSARPNAWRYHLREMALAEEPLRYLRRYLHLPEDPERDIESVSESSPVSGPASRVMTESGKAKALPEHISPRRPSSSTSPATASAAGRAARPLPAEPPAFLKRPYRPAPK